MDTLDILKILMLVVFIVFVILWSIRIVKKARKGSRPKVKRAISITNDDFRDLDSDAIFNSIIATKRISASLRKRGIDTTRPDNLIRKAEGHYDSGSRERAKDSIKQAKNLLMALKREWDDKTGFDVLPGTSSEATPVQYKETVDLQVMSGTHETGAVTEEEEEELITGTAQRKPDNYLPSKFTISLANTVIEDARSSGEDVSEAERILMDAKDCFINEDYDKAFKCALDAKKKAQELLGIIPSRDEEGEAAVSDLSVAGADAVVLKICSMCGERKEPYISIEVKGGEEVTCKECYDRSMGKVPEPEPETKAKPRKLLKKKPGPKETEGEEPKEEEAEKEEEAVIKEEEEQLYCPNCGAKVKNEDVFCGKCGKPVKEELKCLGCGTKVEPGDMFCRKCGARLVN